MPLASFCTKALCYWPNVSAYPWIQWHIAAGHMLQHIHGYKGTLLQVTCFSTFLDKGAVLLLAVSFNIKHSTTGLMLQHIPGHKSTLLLASCFSTSLDTRALCCKQFSTFLDTGVLLFLVLIFITSLDTRAVCHWLYASVHPRAQRHCYWPHVLEHPWGERCFASSLML